MVDLVAVETVAALVWSVRSVLGTGGRNDLGDDVSQFADGVVLFCLTDVESRRRQCLFYGRTALRMSVPLPPVFPIW